MKPGKWLVVGLLALNGVLGAGLYYRLAGTPAAYGQMQGRSSYLTVATSNGQVYVLNTNTGVLVTFQSQGNNNTVQAAGRTLVASDFERARARAD